MPQEDHSWPGWQPHLFDPRRVPLSIADSFLALSWLAEDGAYWIRNLRGGDEHTNQGRLLRLTLPAEPTFNARLFPDALEFSGAGQGTLQVAFLNPETLVIRSTGCPIALQSAAGKYDYIHQGGNRARLCVARQDLQCDCVVQRGELQTAADWNGLSSSAIALTILPEGGVAEVLLHFFRVEPMFPADGDVTAARAASRAAFAAFDRRWPAVAPAHQSARLLASYILWSARVPAEGVLSRPSVFMSKNSMNNIWSWDNCFVARGLALQDAQLAFDQMAVIFAAQHESGRLPDFINDRYAYWSFTKPPVHGWTFARLRALSPSFYDQSKLRMIAGWLERQAHSWLASPSFGGLPAYRHGNDAGWDNATVFAEGGPVVTPDLIVFLCLTLDEVAACCDQVGLTARAQEARNQSQALIDQLVEVLWTGHAFASRHQSDGTIVQTGNSLLAFMPLLLGERLPGHCRDPMIATLKQPGQFLTRHGLATEALGSPAYKSDGYWRGPIWAPTTTLLVAGLEACGEAAFARQLAARFCAMAGRSGMAENFNAETGEGLSDPAFAWTSAVYMDLAHRLAETAELHIENDFIVR
jgi:glycogen debranching enzyme